MEILELLAASGLDANTLVLVFFGVQLTNQIASMQSNQQQIIMQLIRICADDDDDERQPDAKTMRMYE